MSSAVIRDTEIATSSRAEHNGVLFSHLYFMNGNMVKLLRASNKKGIKKVDYLDFTSFEAGLLNLGQKIV